MSDHSQINPRTLKVQNVGDNFKKEVIPQIRLQGKWLLVAGIRPDSHIHITNPQPGVLLLQSLD
jgi:hypothetical protein